MEERFWEKVDKNGPTPDFAPHLGPCWLWLAAKGSQGYAAWSVSNTESHRAHRWLYQRLVAPVPPELELDHLCRVRHCVNPAHLEPVTNAENNRRRSLFKTHCKYGHPFDDENTGIYKGLRYCRECGRQRCRAAYWRRKRENATSPEEWRD